MNVICNKCHAFVAMKIRIALADIDDHPL